MRSPLCAFRVAFRVELAHFRARPTFVVVEAVGRDVLVAMDDADARARRSGAVVRALAAWLTAKDVQRVAAALPKGSQWAATLADLNR